MTKILLLAGGSSSEREVSLRSGAAVSKALIKNGYEVIGHDPSKGMAPDLLQGIDVVFPVLHGAGGEDGELQRQLEEQNARFVGSGSTASKLCFNKDAYRKFLQQCSLPVASGKLVTEDLFWRSPLRLKPFVLKPYDGGSSVDTYILRDEQLLQKDTINELFSHHEKMLLEALVVGIEITVGVLDDQALPVVEIIPPVAGEFNYENKYNGKTIELCPPVHVPQETQAKAQELALNIHKLTGCRDMSRTDIIVTNTQKLFVLETNTIPGMTDQSLLPRAAAAAGLSMEQLVDQLVKAAISRD